MINSNFIITISREFGTNGRKVANELSKLLNVKVYDRRLLEELNEQFHLTTEEMDDIKARKQNWWNDFLRFYQRTTAYIDSDISYSDVVTTEQLYKAEENILKTLAEHESCIILGRTGFHIFRDYPNAFKVFLIADKQTRRERVSKRLNVSEGKADKIIDDIDEARENYTKAFCSKSRYDARNYDIVLNVTHLEPQQIAAFLAECVNQKLNANNATLEH